MPRKCAHPKDSMCFMFSDVVKKCRIPYHTLHLFLTQPLSIVDLAALHSYKFQVSSSTFGNLRAAMPPPFFRTGELPGFGSIEGGVVWHPKQRLIHNVCYVLAC